MSYGDQLRDIANAFFAERTEVATARDIAAWAIRSGRWRPQPGTLIDRCAEELSRAMREEYTVDPQGRSVRTKHAARIQSEGRQITLWADIRTASHGHMLRAFQQRRKQILGDCWQLKCDADSYNENRRPGEPVQIIFDFSLDLEEREAAAHAA